MKTLLRILKWVGIVLLVIIVGLLVAIFSLQHRKFDAPYPDIHASTDSAVIAHGKYLVFGPAHCAECHVSEEDYKEVVKGIDKPLSGGFDFELPLGDVYSKNITPDKETGIGNFSDGEIARTLRYGVKKDGTALIPFMNFFNMSDEDLTAVISYLRTMEPVQKQVPETHFNLMGKAVMAFMIKPPKEPASFSKSVTPDTTADYGKYLANTISNCVGCHTSTDMRTGKQIGEPFAGGMKMESATGEKNIFCMTPNLTPDPETGRISKWTQQEFIDRFREGKKIDQSVMPWGPFKNYSDGDLKAIYNYLKSLPPVKNDTGPAVIKES